MEFYVVGMERGRARISIPHFLHKIQFLLPTKQELDDYLAWILCLFV